MRAVYRFQQPFWIVTIVSGFLALASGVFFLAIYMNTRTWHYLAILALVVMVLVAHGVAWWLALARERTTIGIWLIAGAQILSAVAAPALFDDYWIVGVLLLSVVPLEVGIADKLRYMPVSIVFVLLASACMLAIDLVDLPSRLTIFVDQPQAIFLAILFLTLHIGGLIFLLWRLRLRPNASHFTRLDLGTQQTLVLTLISAGSILLVTGVLIAQIRSSQIQQVGQNFETLAKINGERVGNSLEEQINALVTFTRRESVIVDGLLQTNGKYPATQAAALKFLEQLGQHWRASPDNSEFVLRYRNNAQTAELSKFRGADMLYNNLILTDRMGGLVAAQGPKPERFIFRNEVWWQAAWNHGQGGIYLGDLKIDPETKTGTIFVAISVLNPQTNQIIGVLASTYDLRSIQRDISIPKTQAAGNVRLLTRYGTVIAGPSPDVIGTREWPGTLESSSETGAGQDVGQVSGQIGMLQTQGFMGTDDKGTAVVIAHAS
ncbi:MAG: hypothetical protein EHM70_15560, partial [Chloroflexota bacterium]